MEKEIKRTVYGVGYIGVGRHKSGTSKKKTKVYRTWSSMLQRSYDNKYHEKYTTYLGCSVTEVWHNFQNFGDWFEENYKEGFVLDKDILKKGNKIYSPETCTFIPEEINVLFTKSNKSRGKYPIGVCYDNDAKKFAVTGKVRGKKRFTCQFEAFQYYKEDKEAHIKQIADKWKPQITPQTYEALYNYQVEITD